MNETPTVLPYWKKLLVTPVGQLLKGNVTGPVDPLAVLETSSLPSDVTAAIRNIATRFRKRRQARLVRQLLKKCDQIMETTLSEQQLVEYLSDPAAIAHLIQTTGSVDAVLDTPIPASLWLAVDSLLGQRRWRLFRKRFARRQLIHVSRTLQWQLNNGQPAEQLAAHFDDAVALSGLINETQAPNLLLDCELPAEIVAVVQNVIHKTRLWPNEKAETARELFAHFSDGLAKGRTPAEMIESYGDVVTSAKLIRRASLRNRPFWWQARRRVLQTTAAVAGVLLVVWAILAVRFMNATPTVTYDLVQERDDASRAIPVEQRAWPLYRKGLIQITTEEWAKYRELRLQEALRIGPANENWTEAVAFLDGQAESLELFLKASGRPELGFINRSPENDEWLHKTYVVNPGQLLNPPERTAFETLLPQLQELATFVVPMLAGAAHSAAQQGNADRVLELLQAQLAIATHYGQSASGPVSDIGSCMLTAVVAKQTQQLLLKYPALFSDRQLGLLSRSLASQELRQPAPDASGFMYDDIMQKAYTDDGNGNGRITIEGFQILRRIALMYGKEPLLTAAVPPGQKDPFTDDAESTSFQIMAAPVAALIADRKEMREKLIQLDRMSAEVTRIHHDPASRYEKLKVYRAEYDRLLNSPLLRTKYLLALILAAEPDRLQEQPWRWKSIPTGQVKRGMALMTLAAEQYRRQEGKYPTTATDLVPGFLAAIPIDPLTNEPIRYALVDGQPTFESPALVEPE